MLFLRFSGTDCGPVARWKKTCLTVVLKNCNIRLRKYTQYTICLTESRAVNWFNVWSCFVESFFPVWHLSAFACALNTVLMWIYYIEHIHIFIRRNCLGWTLHSHYVSAKATLSSQNSQLLFKSWFVSTICYLKKKKIKVKFMPMLEKGDQ